MLVMIDARLVREVDALARRDGEAKKFRPAGRRWTAPRNIGLVEGMNFEKRYFLFQEILNLQVRVAEFHDR